MADIVEYIKPFNEHVESYPPSYTTSTSWQTKASLPLTLKPGRYCLRFSAQFLAPAGGNTGEVALGINNSPFIQSYMQALAINTPQLVTGHICFTITVAISFSLTLLFRSTAGGSIGISMGIAGAEEIL